MLAVSGCRNSERWIRDQASVAESQSRQQYYDSTRYVFMSLSLKLTILLLVCFTRFSSVRLYVSFNFVTFRPDARSKLNLFHSSMMDYCLAVAVLTNRTRKHWVRYQQELLCYIDLGCIPYSTGLLNEYQLRLGYKSVNFCACIYLKFYSNRPRFITNTHYWRVN